MPESIFQTRSKAEDMMEIWEPFAEQMELYEAWGSYNDEKQEKELTFSAAESKCPDIVAGYQHRSIAYVYQGVVTGDLNKYYQDNENGFTVFLMGSAWKPIVNKFEFSIFSYNNYIIVYKYLIAYFQEKYRMTICYENEQAVSFEEKKDNSMEETYDLFPPMMFCMAASDWSRQYICSAKPFMRRGITADHPFATWLLDNAAKLNKYYPRQFQQIVNCLCEDSAEDIAERCDYIREQMLRFPENHGVDVSAFPQLRLTGFWLMKEE